MQTIQIDRDIDLDPEGYCVEWYFNDRDVKCMIRLKPSASV
jgi:hypothetical protein